jgi:hypothetical protein
MRTVIAGSRHFTDGKKLEQELNRIPYEITKVLSGCARGADSLGEWWAQNHKVPIEQYPAEWDTYGRSAGFVRNEKMAKNCDLVIVFWDGNSKGTKHMIDLAIKYEKELLVVYI